jgi:hypothetical protein
MRVLIVSTVFLLACPVNYGQATKRTDPRFDSEDSEGQRRQKKSDPSRAMICAAESQLRAATSEVLHSKDKTVVEWGREEGRQNFSSRKWGKDIIRFLFAPSAGPARADGCYDVRLDRAWNRFSPAPSKLYCVEIDGRTDCFTYRVWEPGEYSVRRALHGDKTLDKWLIEIKRRAEGEKAAQ